MSGLTTFDSNFFTLSDDHGITSLVMGRGQLTEEENLEQLDRELISLVDTYQVRKILLDMANVSYLNSAGIGKLISLHRRLARINGLVVLCNLSPTVSEILEHSHLLNYFKVASDQDNGRALLA